MNNPEVMRVVFSSGFVLHNFEARGIVQTGTSGNEAYHAAGLKGENQVFIYLFIINY